MTNLRPSCVKHRSQAFLIFWQRMNVICNGILGLWTVPAIDGLKWILQKSIRSTDVGLLQMAVIRALAIESARVQCSFGHGKKKKKVSKKLDRGFNLVRSGILVTTPSDTPTFCITASTVKGGGGAWIFP